MTNTGLPATPRQHAYLRALARRTGTTFVVPANRADASREIKRLEAIGKTGFTFAEIADSEARKTAG